MYIFWSHYPQQRRVAVICNLNATSWNRKLFGGGQQAEREKSIRTPAKERPLLLIQLFGVRRRWAFSDDAASFVSMFVCNRIRNHRPTLSFHTQKETDSVIIQCGAKPITFLRVLEWAAKTTGQNVLLMAQQRTANWRGQKLRVGCAGKHQAIIYKRQKVFMKYRVCVLGQQMQYSNVLHLISDCDLVWLFKKNCRSQVLCKTLNIQQLLLFC